MPTITETEYPRFKHYVVGSTPTKGPFDIPFPFLDEDTVLVLVGGVEEQSIQITQSTIYGTTGNTVHLDAEVSDTTVTIISDTGSTRSTGETFVQTELSDEIDRIFSLLQEQKEELGRSVRLSIPSGAVAAMEAVAEGRAIIRTANGFGEGPTAGDIANAQQNATDAEAAKDAAEEARDAAVAAEASITALVPKQIGPVTGDGTATTLTIAGVYTNPNLIFVYVDTGFQDNFTLSNDGSTTTLTFDAPFPKGAVVKGRAYYQVASPVAEASAIVPDIDGRSVQAIIEQSGVPFQARASAQAANINAAVKKLTITENGRELSFERDGAGTALATVDGTWSPLNRPMAYHWGATSVKTEGEADAAADNAPAVQGVLDWMVAQNDYGKLRFELGYHNLQSPITAANQKLIIGEGGQATKLHADHTDGEVIRFKEKWSGLRDIELSASEDRQAAAPGSLNVGARFEGDDIADEGDASKNLYFEVKGVYSVDQPDADFYFVGPAAVGLVQKCSVAGGQSHGFVLDRGGYGGRTNLIEARTGRFDMWETRFGAKPGHGVAVGAPNGAYPGADYSTPGLAVSLWNCEGSAGTDPSKCYTNSFLFLRGSEHRAEICGFNHDNAFAFLAGRDMAMKTNRLLNAGFVLTFDATDSGVVDTSTNTINIANHKLKNANLVRYGIPQDGSAIGGLFDGHRLFVVNATSGSFQLSETIGGPPVDLTALGGEAGHTIGFGGHFYIIGTYDQLSTDGLYLDGMKVISAPCEQYPAIQITLPAGETILPRNIFIRQGQETNIRKLIDVDDTIGKTVTFDPADVDTGADHITKSGHGLANHEAVIYDNAGNTSVGGLTQGGVYFVEFSGGDIQLFDAVGGTAVDLTSAGSGSGHILHTGRNLNSVDRIYVNDRMVPKKLMQDVPIFNRTGLVRLHDLDFTVDAYERCYFRWEIEFDSPVNADAEFTVTASTGSLTFAVDSGLLMNASGTVIAGDIESSGGRITVTGGSSGRRLVIAGYFIAADSDETLNFWATQDTAQSANTTLKAHRTRVRFEVEDDDDE